MYYVELFNSLGCSVMREAFETIEQVRAAVRGITELLAPGDTIKITERD